MDGIEATKRIKAEFPLVRIIGLSVQNEEHVQAAMKQAGATSFLNKDAAIEDLYQAIQTARQEDELSIRR
jgi:DNA-binding NarL/FixJ family response regulator